MKKQFPTRPTTAEEFHQQLGTAMSTKKPHLIEAKMLQHLKPMIAAAITPEVKRLSILKRK